MRRYSDSSTQNIDLKKFAIFNHLKSYEFEQIERRMNVTKLKKNSIVYHEGCTFGGVYLVVNGILKIYKTGKESKEQIVRFAKAGDLIGYEAIMTNKPSESSAATVVESVLCYIPGEELTKLFTSNNEFAVTLMQISCKHINESYDFILELGQKTVRERLAMILLRLMDTFDLDEEKRLKIALTREDLANMVGTATESIIRLLSEFKALNLIELQGRYIKMMNIQELIKISNIRL